MRDIPLESFCEECGGPIDQMGTAHHTTTVGGKEFCSEYCSDEWLRRTRHDHVKLKKQPKLKRL